MISTLVAIICIAAVAVGLIRLKNQNPDKKLYDIILHEVSRESPGYMLIILLVLVVIESIIAATTTPVNAANEVDQFARTIGHIALGAFQFVAGISISSSIANMNHGFSSGKYKVAISYFLSTFMLLFGMFFAPIMNLQIMAASLEQTRELQFFLYSLKEYLPFSGVGEHQIRVKALMLGFDQRVSPFEVLAAPIILLISGIGIHLIILIIETFHLIATDNSIAHALSTSEKEDKDKGKEDKKEDKKKDEDGEVKTRIRTVINYFAEYKELSPRDTKTMLADAIKYIMHLQQEPEANAEKIQIAAQDLYNYTERIKSVKDDEKEALADDIQNTLEGMDVKIPNSSAQ